jgi:nitroreductase
VDTYLAIASKRDTRGYDGRPIPLDVAERILDAGRLAGSAKNRQPRRFLLVEDAAVQARLAETVYQPGNVRSAALVVALVTPGGKYAFDSGRAAQNMMLAAWNEGVASCPNGMPDPDRTAAVLDLGEEERPVIVLTFGYPARERDPESRPAGEWSARADRRPLEDIVTRL